MPEKIKVIEKEKLYPFIQLFGGVGKIVIDEHIEKQVADPNFLRPDIEKAAKNGASYYYTLYDKWFMYQAFDDPNFKPNPHERRHWPGDETYFKYHESVYKVCRELNLKFGTECLRTMDLAVGFWKQHPEDCGGFWSLGECLVLADGSFEIKCPNPGKMEGNPGESPMYFDSVKGIFAFKEKKIESDDFYKWNVLDVKEITRETEYKVRVGEAEVKQTGVLPPKEAAAQPGGEVVITGKWKKPTPNYKVYAIVFLRAGEFDYADGKGVLWAKKLVEEFNNRGVKMNVFYQDEPHVWWHWGNWGKYTEGLGLPKIAYMTDRFAALFRGRWRTDFAKNILALLPSASNEGRFIGTSADSLLFRARYYEMLQNLFVRFSIELRKYAESKWGESALIGHDTWCNTIGDAAAARELRVGSLASWKYRKWWKNGGRADHGESGHVEFDYYGESLAASWSKGAKPEWGYYGYWSLKPEGKTARDCIFDIEGAFGLSSRYDRLMMPVRGLGTRRSRILSIFPENFAFHYPMHQWYSATGYFEWLTDMEFSWFAEVTRKKILWAKNFYDALVVQFTPQISREAFAKIRSFAASGGTVIWLGAPPLRYFEGGDAKRDFEKLAGCKVLINDLTDAVDCSDKKVEYYEELAHLGRISIEDCGRLHYWIDFGQSEPVKEVGYRSLVYPVEPKNCSEVARVGGMCAGTIAETGKGRIIYLGFCPPFETLYKILLQYKLAPEVVRLSHDTDYLVTEFECGAVTVTRHLKGNMDPVKRDLRIDMKISDHNIKYEGSRIMSYLLDAEGKLAGFMGVGCRGINIDKKDYVFSGAPLNFSFGPLREAERKNSYLLRFFKTDGNSEPVKLSLPVNTSSWKKPALVIDREHKGGGEISRELPKAGSINLEIAAGDMHADIFITDIG